MEPTSAGGMGPGRGAAGSSTRMDGKGGGAGKSAPRDSTTREISFRSCARYKEADPGSVDNPPAWGHHRELPCVSPRRFDAQAGRSGTFTGGATTIFSCQTLARVPYTAEASPYRRLASTSRPTWRRRSASSPSAIGEGGGSASAMEGAPTRAPPV
jgi:hypothetical protein